MAKYHINDDGPAICRAGVRSCPVGGTHFDSLEEADSHYENILAEVHGGSFKKKNQPKATVKDFDSWHPDLSYPLPSNFSNMEQVNELLNIVKKHGTADNETLLNEIDRVGTSRSIRYYVSSCGNLNLLYQDKSTNEIILTDFGKKYLSLNDNERKIVNKKMISSLWAVIQNNKSDEYADSTLKERLSTIKKLAKSIDLDLKEDHNSYVSKRTQEIIDNGEKFVNPRKNINNFENSLEKTKEICPECFMDKRTCLCEDD